MKDTGNRLISNSAFLFLDWIILTVLSLVFWIIIGKLLPREAYGIVSTAANFIIIFSSIALLGLNGVLVKLIPEFLEKNQYDNIRRLTKFSVKTGLSVGLVFAAAIILLAPVLSPILNLSVDTMILIGIGIFILSVWGLTTAVIQGFQNMKRIMKTDLFGNSVKIVLTLAMVLLGFSYLGPLLGFLIGIVAIILLRLDTLFLFRLKGGEKSKPGKNGLNFKSIFTYSTSALLGAIAMLGFANTPNIILNSLTGPGVTALFAISLTITSPLFSIPSVLNSALFPITSGLSAKKGNEEKQRTLIRTVIRYASFVTLPVIAVLLAFSETVILFFSSPEFLPAVDLLPITGVAAFMFGLGSILSISIYALGKPVVSRNIIFVALGVFFALSFPLTIAYTTFGMAAAYLIATTTFFVANTLYMKKFIGLSLGWTEIAKVVLAVLIFYGMLFGIDSLFSNNIIKLVGAIAALVVYMFLLIPLKFYQRDDLKVLDFLVQKSPVGKNLFRFLYSVLSKYVR